MARSGTRRVPATSTLPLYSAGPNPPRKTLDDIQQGIRTLYAPEYGTKPDIDIVFVPGLGAEPERSWQSTKGDFNWIKDKDGLARDFPKARLLLFQYESAWAGGLRVKQFIQNIAFTLCMAIRSCREQRSNTPLVLVGHSMGGLVIAKAIINASSRRDQFPAMFECISGCVFFGTPFGGAEAASTASMLATLGAKLDKATSSKLLDMMKPDDEGLREMKNEFMALANPAKGQRIELFCFYENHPTNFAEQAGLPAIFGIAIPKKIAEFVTRNSATLPGISEAGLASNHRNLVKFDSPKDSIYQLVRDQLKVVIHGAPLVAKNRFNATRNIDWETLKDVKRALEGTDVQYTRRILARKQTPSAWLIAEQEYLSWRSDDAVDRKRVDGVWIRGQAGRGKTSNVLTVLNDLEQKLSVAVNGRQAPMLVYFFCDPNSEQSTAEDVLKSFLYQLVEQQVALIPYAKHFAKKKKDDSKEPARSTLQTTIENMWQSIQDMLYDEFIGSTVYFVINNIHALPEEAPSTQKLLEYIRADLSCSPGVDSSKTTVRWLVSSRKVDNLTSIFGHPNVRLMDLEDEKYEDQVQKELRKHAYNKVAALREEKKYDRDVAYFAHSLIGKRAQNTQWIDIACLQLKALTPNDSRLKVRQILETMPQDLNELLENAWQQVFRQNINVIDNLKEMLRAMVLTFEDPSASELEVLAGMSENDDERSDLRQLVEKCKPLLTIRREGDGLPKIGFMNIVVKSHLLQNSGSLLGLKFDETQWQHGILAFRAFEYLTDTLDAIVVPDEDVDNQADQDHDAPEDHVLEDDQIDTISESGQTHKTIPDHISVKEATVADALSQWGGDETEYSSDDDDYEEEEDVEEHNPEAMAVRDQVLPYIVKYWIRHAALGSKDVAYDLVVSDDNDFWVKDSKLRRRWLLEFTRLDGRLADMPFHSHSGLHVAASVGFPRLVSALIENGHEADIHEVDEWQNTPVS